ncbi:MAG: hypothetical protein RLZZ350_2581 [Verrucomicrobiota bacterium]|jgi:hypothetical protein
MKTLTKIFFTLAVLGWCVLPVSAAATNTNHVAKAAATLAATNAVVVDTNAYVANFDAKVRDPFFPRSTRANADAGPGDEASATVNLILKGISGTAKRRCAIINDHTFMAGDESEVSTGTGRIRIHCYSIHSDGAFVSIGANPDKIELRLPSHY